MNKNDIMRALQCCSCGNCVECPYDGKEECDAKMCADAISMLKANKPAYSLVYIYTKRTNLSAYMSAKVTAHCSDNAYQAMREHYAKERDVKLIAMFRWDGAKCFCKIKCPINPLPVKGEFETPTTGAVDRFLKANGWSFEQRLYPRMFE